MKYFLKVTLGIKHKADFFRIERCCFTFNALSVFAKLTTHLQVTK